MVIEQFLPALHYGDAVGNMVLKLHDFFQKKGLESRIVALDVDESLKERATLFSDYSDVSNAVKILHFAVPSELTGYFKNCRGKKVMVYHNVTPPEFFCNYSEDIVRLTSAGYQHLDELKDVFDSVIAVSEFNAQGLLDAGYKKPEVFPVLLELEDFDKPYSKGYYELFNDDRKNIVFVGRVVPNKKIEDLVKMIFFYKKYISPSVRLIIAGNPDAVPKYYHAIRDLAARFLLTSDDIFFTGHIPFDELLAVYAGADLFVSMSEHEGFFVPMMECFKLNIPVMAYGAGAIPETAGEGAMIFNDKSCEKTAALADTILNDQNLQKRLKEAGKKRLEEYMRAADAEKFLKILEKTLMKICVVVQRYGEDIIGGAETLAKDVAERLNRSGDDVNGFLPPVPKIM